MSVTIDLEKIKDKGLSICLQVQGSSFEIRLELDNRELHLQVQGSPLDLLIRSTNFMRLLPWQGEVNNYKMDENGSNLVKWMTTNENVF